MGSYEDRPSTIQLASSKLFQRQDGAPRMEMLDLTYRRAMAISHEYGLTMNDVLRLSPKFWDLHMDPISSIDPAAYTLVSIQYNLAAGVIAEHAVNRPDLKPLMDKMLKFEVSAQFMLTELDHGLDAKNLETSATLQPDGSFILQTPTPGAAKYMPPTMPIAGLPRVGIVMAKLMVEGEDRGIRQFVVPLGDGKQMCKGVTTRLLPAICGGRFLDHAITHFEQVSLASDALLGSFERPTDKRSHFASLISRVSVGTLALSLGNMSAIKCAAYIVGKYSMRRKILGPKGAPTPIIMFRTQHMPVLHAIAQVAVMEPFARKIISLFKDPLLNDLVKHGLATTLKAVFQHHGQMTMSLLMERCGAQGLFDHNQIAGGLSALRANMIAEGDILVLCIRLASELILGRYELPGPMHPECLLAQHEEGLFDEVVENLPVSDSNRTQDYNEMLLPRSRAIVEAIGHRMVYESALEAGVDPDLLALYEVGVIKLDASWYVQHAGLTRFQIADMERKALNAVQPRLDYLLDRLEVAPYCTAPIVKESALRTFESGLEEYSGDGIYDYRLQGCT